MEPICSSETAVRNNVRIRQNLGKLQRKPTISYLSISWAARMGFLLHKVALVEMQFGFPHFCHQYSGIIDVGFKVAVRRDSGSFKSYRCNRSKILLNWKIVPCLIGDNGMASTKIAVTSHYRFISQYKNLRREILKCYSSVLDRKKLYPQ
jgi:hypothetical protein